MVSLPGMFDGGDWETVSSRGPFLTLLWSDEQKQIDYSIYGVNSIMY